MKHIQKLRKLILTLGIFAGMSLTAYAAPAETLLTTITATGKTTYSQSEEGVATVTLTNISFYDVEYGWLWNGTITVEPVEGYTITKCRFIQNSKTPLDDDLAPFSIVMNDDPEAEYSCSVITSTGQKGGWSMDGVTSIEVYGYATPVAVTGVSLNKNSTTLTVGGTETLTATVSPDGATDKTVTWSSDNTSVATVDANGKVTAASAGTANITATATNGTDDTSDDKQATCTVTVTADKTALNTAITAAETLYNSIKDNTDYSNIASALEPAINAAKGVAGSDTADQNAVDAATTAITTAKTNAEAAIEKDKADTAAANAVIEKINALPATAAITSANKDAIEAARAAYDALTDNQKAKIGDTVKNKLKAAETAVVAAEFNEYKEAQKTAAENKAQDGDSDATNALITAAKAKIDALTYDATKTLDENKAAVTAVVTQLATAIAAQRAAEQPVTVTAKADTFTTGTYYATFYDSTKSYTADCEVYYATANADGRLKLQKAEGNVIKAGEGVILKATSETVTLTKTTTEASYDSLLTGSDRETTVENALVLSLGKNGVWFYKYSGTLGANKAYLLLIH